MPGWNLKEGQVDNRQLSQDEFWDILKYVFSNQTRKTTSYKFCFLKSILDNIFICDHIFRLSYRQVFDTVAEIYWNLIHIHHIRQQNPSRRSSASKIEILINQIADSKRIPDDTYYEYLDQSSKIELKKNTNQEISKYVVGALFDDTSGRLFGFSHDKQILEIHPDAYKYLTRHKYLVEKLNYYEWLKFLEKVNPEENAYALAQKLDQANKRKSLKKYRAFLSEVMGQEVCFYCGRELKACETHVDHFIPWSYVKSNQLWNFVLTCKQCNIKKRDQLPEINYLDELLLRNQRLSSMLDHEMVGEEFSSYYSDKLVAMFEGAMHNGLETGWKA